LYRAGRRAVALRPAFALQWEHNTMPSKPKPRNAAGKSRKPRRPAPKSPPPRSKKKPSLAQAPRPADRDILERVSDSFVALDAEWRYTYVNEKAAATFGRTPDQLIGKHIWTEFPEGVGQPFYHAYHKAMETQQAINIEEYYPPYDRWFENRIYPSPDGLTIFFHDVTDRKQAELALQAAHRDLRRILRAANVGLWDWDLRTNAVYFSPEWKAQLGYEDHEIPNQFSEWETRVHPDDLEAALAAVKGFIENPRPDFANEFRLRHRDGSWRHILAQASLEFDENGKPNRMLGSHIDITERRRMDEQLQRSEHLLRLFVEYSPAAIAMFNRDMEYIVASRRYLIDYDLGEQDVTGRSHYEVFPEMPDRWKQIHRRCLAGAVESAEEDPFPRASGELDWIRWEIRPWYAAGGEIGGVILFSEVITNRKQAEAEIRQLNAELEQRVLARTAQLRAANKELESFSYSVSHDLRAPLRAINGFAAILARRHRQSLDEEGRHYLDNIIEASERMGLVIDHLLNYVRMGRAGQRSEPVALAGLLATLAGDLRGRLEELGGELHVAPDLPVVNGDRELLTQIFSNLLENALAYHRPGVPPRVAVTAENAGPEIRITVSDNGIGIPEEHHARIFNIFQRLHSQEEYPGTGIGLATVQKAAELLGGRVGVESRVGAGSRFIVELPGGNA
jgi:PAS domain S-box-containing protein